MTDGINVLIVDDDADMRRLLVEIVGRRKLHQVVSAESAEHALSLLPLWSFQVALLDHNLPGLEGLLLGEYLRRSNPRMRIAMVSGSDPDRMKAQCEELGLEFVPKPFEPQDIFKIIDAYLAGEEEQRRQVAAKNDEEFMVDLRTHSADLTAAFRVPNVPGRVSDRLVETIKRGLSNMKSPGRYTERERAIVYSGLVASKVLGLSLPRDRSGLTLYQEYDRIMTERGRRAEF